jgi:hypothetical protein
VIDRVTGTSVVDTHWAESRFHTLAESTSGTNWVSLKRGKERMMMTFAALGKGSLQTSRGMPSQPHVQATTIYRWMGAAAAHDNLQVAALNPGSKKLGLSVTKEKGNTSVIEVIEPDGKIRRIRLGPTLTLR